MRNDDFRAGEKLTYRLRVFGERLLMAQSPVRVAVNFFSPWMTFPARIGNDVNAFRMEGIASEFGGVDAPRSLK